MVNSVTKLLTITFIVNWVTSSLALQYTHDDILTFPRYQVLLTNEKISNSQIQEKDIEVSSTANDIVMMSASGQPFSCSIPNVQIEQERLEREKEERAKEETEEDIQNTIDRGLDLLEPLGNNCMRFYASTYQYWVYEYCHNQYVRQFHVERSHDGKSEKETNSNYLGIYPGSLEDMEESLDNKENSKALSSKRPKKSNVKAPTQMRKVGDQRYLVQEWKNGSYCDLAKRPRTVEVQFHCDNQGQDRVSSFIEVSTCHYQIEVSTPRLCEEMNLSLKHYTELHKIKCRPIVSDKLIEQEKNYKVNEEYLISEQQQEEEEEKVTPVTATDPKKDVVDEKEEIQKLLDSVVSKEAREDDKLLGLISDLTEQITLLRNQMNSVPTEQQQKASSKKTEYSLFTLDEHGNIIPGVDLDQLISKQQQKKPQTNTNNDQAKDQHNNKQAYEQNYIE